MGAVGPGRAVMAISVWEIEGHRVSLTHGYWLGAATIAVDDQVVFERPRNIIVFGFAHRFEIDGTPVAVQVFSDGICHALARASGQCFEASAGEISKIVHDLETFSEFGGFFFQFVSSSAWRGACAEGIIEEGVKSTQ
jgi:hypothetical protein